MSRTFLLRIATEESIKTKGLVVGIPQQPSGYFPFNSQFKLVARTSLRSVLAPPLNPKPYLMRGYPENLVMSWFKKNIQERWEKRFALRVAEHDESILVLKTRFDQVWNWFSAAELGKTGTEYWSAWYEHAEKGLYSADSSRPLIKPDPNYVHDLDDVRPELFTQILVDGETEFVPDLRKIGLLGSRWIVSRKRNTNLFDLANVWKKTVFRKLDENIAEKGGVVPETQNVNETYHSALVEAAEQISIESDNEIILHRRSISQEREHPEFGRISKSYNR
ncbi:hypothetical protein JR316_0008573 [Psilocybe cubensis]|uniref:Uncharacterized protein n=2 Tax=Psilocybe cubensis TaxID=181762 RepID=A0ACB8GWH5_PSICU|nr:hypothetical protein JR316_0008573 [Psilocybe cubensis]KAH9479976.1 hypothetical protein JR316_0008573 [Psilocybe cubensis]